MTRCKIARPESLLNARIGSSRSADLVRRTLVFARVGALRVDLIVLLPEMVARVRISPPKVGHIIVL